MGLAAAKKAAKILKPLAKNIFKKKKTKERKPGGESMDYRRKLIREENKGERRAKSKIKKKAEKVEQMSEARLEREKQLANPYLTYEDRAKLLGGMKKGGMLKKPTNPGLKKLPTPVRNKMGYMKKGGVVKKGHHRMPDGTIMKDSEHKKMKHGGAVKGKCRMDGIAIRGKTRAKQRSK